MNVTMNFHLRAGGSWPAHLWGTVVKQHTPDSCLYFIPPPFLQEYLMEQLGQVFTIQFCPLILGYDLEILLVVLSIFLTLSYHLPSPEGMGS